MAKRHLEQYDKNGNMLDIYLNEEEVMVGDQTLAEKLADMEDDIDDAAQTGGEGTVTGIKVGSNTYEPTEGVVDISGAVPTSTSDLNNNSDFTTKAYVDAAVQAVQTALNNLMNGQSVTDAIDTFNEIVDFLDDIDTDDPTLSNQLLALNNAITALQTALAGKISGIKANGASTTLPVDQNGIVELPPAGSTISPADTAPQMDGNTANVGSSAKYAREDHVHPHDSTKLSKSDVSVETQGDGTVDINVGSGANKDTYTINLNHTHENMAKLIVCEESDLPSTLDNSTIYAITDSGETEIEKLIIRGMEFAGGGGTPSTEPKIVSPIGTQIDFNGESAKTVTVRATNLSESLTIAVTGITASLQTISANDAENGVQLTLTKGQNFDGGTLRIYSSEVDKSWTVFDSQEYQAIAGVKLTGTQWLQTDYQPNPNTEFELDMKLETNANTDIRQGLSSGISSYILQCNLLSDNTFYVNTAGNEAGSTSYRFLFRNTTASQAVQQLDFSSNQSAMLQRSILSYKKSGSSMIMSFNGVSATLPVKQGTAGILNIGYIDSSYHIPLNRWNLYIYSFKIIENGVVVRNYSPVIKKNGVPGLYDDVTDTFISSMSQTDEVVPIYDN